MVEWMRWVETRHPLAGLPQLLAVCTETQTKPTYVHHGRLRKTESHCIFKITLEGEGRFRDGRGVHAVGPGFGFLCEVADPRTSYWYPQDGHAPWRFIYAAFGGAVTAMVHAIVARFGSVLPVPAELVRRMQAFQPTGPDPRFVTPIEGAQFVTDLLWAVAGAAECAQVERLDVPDLVRRAQDKMQAEAGTIASVGQWAARMGVSREHLTRVFRQQTGRTPRLFLEWCRLREACRYLKETPMSVKQVASEVGFSAPSDLSRVFRRRLGMSPRRFREVGAVPLSFWDMP